MRGHLILVEGLDRSGKTTQTDLIVKYFQQKAVPCELIKFPNRDTSIGHIINQYLTKQIELNDQAIHLLFSSNRWELHDEIIRKLESGVTVILDRYLYSGIVYSAAKGLSFEWCKNCDIGLARPDLSIFLNIDIEQTAKRGQFGEERYEMSDFQLKVKKLFEDYFSDEFTVVNVNDKSIVEVESEIQQLLSQFIKPTNKPIGEFR